MSKEGLKPDLRVLQKYGIAKKSISSVRSAQKQGNPKIKVWFIRDKKKKRTVVLKVVNNRRALLSIHLQSELAKAGYPAPAVYRTRKGNRYVSHRDGYYFLAEYVPPKGKVSTRQRVQALARFHQTAQFRHLFKYRGVAQYPKKRALIKQYRENIQDMVKWQKKLSASRISEFDAIIRNAKQAVKQMETCHIDAYTRAMKDRYAICHGDYHSRNSYQTNGKRVVVIDYDRAYFGLPIDDFHFLAYSLARKQHYERKLRILWNEYFHVNAQDKPFKKLYKAHLQFPCRLHQYLKKRTKKDNIKKIEKRVDSK